MMITETAREVFCNNRGSSKRQWHVEQADCLLWLRSLPDDCCDLVMCSSPYSDARSYGELDFRLKGEDWVRWMFGVAAECSRVCKGLVVIVCDGKTEDKRYDCTPLLLAADLHRAGYHLRHPCCYFRYGVPGSGSTDWLRNDWEPVLCLSRPGKLPWSDNTACGRPPKYGPGGEMSNRTRSGARVNQWGGRESSGNSKRRSGQPQPPGRPSHWYGDDASPAIANPGNVVKATYDAEEVRQLLAGLATHELTTGDVIRCLAGGGAMGSRLAHENEAPYPESLVEPFVLSFCPPAGLVLDPFTGSGTTGAVAVRHGRRFLGCDLRPCQVALASRRISQETPGLPFGAVD